MSDAYFDMWRAEGTYPRKGYGWCSEESQRKEIQRYIDAGRTEPWILEEALRFGIVQKDTDSK